ncbi:hypothetical protein D920_00280 [Enterococcus faecalis 13-SD-W-01]|nr:hypothetical protein D920_00280 [Enterococcus faecalis 13-SD-W-01]
MSYLKKWLPVAYDLAAFILIVLAMYGIGSFLKLHTINFSLSFTTIGIFAGAFITAYVIKKKQLNFVLIAFAIVVISSRLDSLLGLPSVVMHNQSYLTIMSVLLIVLILLKVISNRAFV